MRCRALRSAERFCTIFENKHLQLNVKLVINSAHHFESQHFIATESNGSMHQFFVMNILQILFSSLTEWVSLFSDVYYEYFITFEMEGKCIKKKKIV